MAVPFSEVSRKVEPSPSLLVKEMFPLCSFIRRRVSSSPMPLPVSLELTAFSARVEIGEDIPLCFTRNTDTAVFDFYGYLFIILFYCD